MGTALVTGATAGLGLEFAWQLATARHDLVIVARDGDRLESVATQIRAAAGVHVEVIAADLASADDVDRVAARLAVGGSDGGSDGGGDGGGDGASPAATAGARPVGLLVNNAGFAPAQRFVGGDVDVELRAVDVMVRAVVRLSHAAAGQMTARGRGAVLNVASVAALTAGGSYSAAKAYVRTFTEGLAAELQGTGVTATVLCPGFVRTEFHDRAGLDMSSVPEIGWLDAQYVAAQALADVRRGVVISTPSARYKAGSALLRVLPRPVVRAIGNGR